VTSPTCNLAFQTHFNSMMLQCFVSLRRITKQRKQTQCPLFLAATKYDNNLRPQLHSSRRYRILAPAPLRQNVRPAPAPALLLALKKESILSCRLSPNRLCPLLDCDTSDPGIMSDVCSSVSSLMSFSNFCHNSFFNSFLVASCCRTDSASSQRASRMMSGDGRAAS